MWAEAYELFRSSLPGGQTDTQAALRYCLSYPEISTVIPGMLRQAEVDENVAASGMGALDPGARKRIETIYQQHEFFLGARARIQQ